MKKVCALILCAVLAVGGAFAVEVEQVFRAGPQVGLGWGSGVRFTDIGASTLWTFDLGEVNLTTGVNANLQDFVVAEVGGVVGVSKDFAHSGNRCIRVGIQANAGICIAGPAYGLALAADWRPIEGSGLILGAAVRYRGFLNLDNFTGYNGFSLPLSLGWKF